MTISTHAWQICSFLLVGVGAGSWGV
ncbi:MAG: hypothetical protein R3E96_02170 [Planctomycetota bacterium]